MAVVGGNCDELLAAPKVLVLCLGFTRDPWASIENEGQRATWASAEHPDVAVRFYYGTLGRQGQIVRSINGFLTRAKLSGLRSRFLRTVGVRGGRRRSLDVGDRIIVPVPDAFVTIGAKTQVALRHVLETQDFDFLFRTNTSSYVNLDLLATLVATQPCRGLYAGHRITNKAGASFVSGAGILMSRDVVWTVAHDSSFDFDLPDDIAIARSVSRVGLMAVPLGRVDIAGLDEVDGLSEEVLASAFHYRCKVRWERTGDIEVMRRLHARIKELEAQ